MRPAAFPVPPESPDEGMTLRDYFAISILQGLMSQDGGTGQADPCRCAYAMADAMLRVRDE